MTDDVTGDEGAAAPEDPDPAPEDPDPAPRDRVPEDGVPEHRVPEDAVPEDAVLSLLVVDDHPVVRDGLRGMFESAPGFTVLGEAANGVEAVALVAELDPDVVLMD